MNGYVGAGDHLVGWANSSIRHPDELPDIDAAMQRKGVIKEDALQAALHPQAAAAFLRHHALDRSSPDSAVDHGKEEKRALEQKDSSDANTSTAAVKQAGNLEEPASSQSGAHQLQSDGAVHESNTIHGSKQEGQQVAAEQIVESSQNALLILTRLQTLPWRRIDVSFEGTRMPFFAHNHIQVTRKWLNWYGNAVCQHLAQQIADMEKHKSIQNLIG